MLGLNEILEPAIFIFKIKTNKISIYIHIEFHNTIFGPVSRVKIPTKY